MSPMNPIDADRSPGPTKIESTPGTAAISSSLSSAASVSICTITQTSSLARLR